MGIAFILTYGFLTCLSLLTGADAGPSKMFQEQKMIKKKESEASASLPDTLKNMAHKKESKQERTRTL